MAAGPERRRWWILLALALAGGLIMLDETVVGVALPALQGDLGLSQVAAHWVINAYMLVFAALVAAGGRLGDLVGWGRLFPIGKAVFGLASLGAGFADGLAGLIIARILQGLGAAAIFPGTIAMVMVMFTPQERGKALGLLVAVATSFLALGPMVGGFLTELVSWRWIFWINLPVAATALLVAMAAWTAPPRRAARTAFDWTGLLWLVTGLSLLVFGLMQGTAWGWRAPAVIAPLLCGLASLGIFFRLELRRDEPLIAVALFRNASFSSCATMLLAGQFSKIALVVFGALYLQRDLAMSPLEAGLALLPSVAAFPLLSASVGHLSDRLPVRRLVLSGLTLASAAMLWIAVAATWKSYLLLLPGLLLWGGGMVFCYAPTMRAMADSVAPEMQGQCSGIGVTARLLGGTLGVALCGGLLTATGGFQPLFFATAAVMLLSLLFGVFSLVPNPKVH
ncbi:MAG TPA: MFS transporter [Kiloniellaceae bacterium]|nr:MFS transporter [Kiloniellaceae bacterium]